MAISSAMVWQVQSTGSDSNGGGFRGGSALAVPSAPSVSATSGGSVTVATYYVVITRQEGLFETAKSAETAVTTTSSNKTIAVTAPSSPTYQSGWNVYVGTASGGPYFLQSANNANGANLNITSTPPTTGTQAPGVDYSLQNGTQVNVNNSTITATTTGANSNVLTFTAGYTPSAADVGNIFRATAGTNINAGAYEITGWTSTTWTVSGASNLTTAGGAGSAITGVMGGALASPGQAATLAVNQNTVFVKQATYTITSTANGSGGRPSVSTGVTWIGYATNRYPFNTDTRPTLQTNANGLTAWTQSGGGNNGASLQNLILDNGSNTGGLGLSISSGPFLIWNVKANNFQAGISASTANIDIYYCEANGFSTIGIDAQQQSTVMYCTAHSTNATGGLIGVRLATSASTAHCVGCVAYLGDTGSAGANTGISAVNGAVIDRCDSYVSSSNASSAAYSIASGRNPVVLSGCVGWCPNGTDFSKTSASCSLMIDCAGHSLASGGINLGSGTADWQTGEIQGYQTLTTDPFTNASGLDFSRNATAGGGAALAANGFPGSTAATQLPGLSTLSYPDIGAAQAQATSTADKYRPRPR
jgi:hypothetical protein